MIPMKTNRQYKVSCSMGNGRARACATLEAAQDLASR